ncbi:MAG TPA: FimV/HubP family polar landmark protein [Steroidobacteraceae bacterium]|jgi:pilus assembly protein FimV
MFKRNFSLALLLALLSPAAALALGLGDIHLKSSLNAPLDADIDLVGASAEDLAGMKATLADRDAFNHGGLDYPGFLGALTITPEKAADGRSVLHVHSANVANEPFATLLISVDWPRGHVVREYTVLLDPPVFSGDGPSKAAVAAPSAGSSARSGSVDHRAAPAPAASATDSGGGSVASAPSAVAGSAESTTSMPTPPPVHSSSAARAAGGHYTVRRGDTLYAVASQNYPGGDRPTRQRQLMAIYRANPSAFEGNMNLLLAGRQLALPTDSDIEAISPGEAASEVHRQNAAWASSHGANAAPSHGNAEAGSGQLHLVPPQEAAKAPASGAPSSSAAAPAAPAAPASGAAAATAGAAAAANDAALNQRVQQLEAQLAESQRLLQVRNADLAALQARAAQNGQNPAKPAAPTPPAAAPTPSSPATPPSAQAPIAPSAPSAPVTGQPVTPPVTPAAPAAKPAAATPAETGSSLLDLIEQYWYVPAALLAVLIILVVLRFVRARQEDEFDRSLGRLQPAFENTPEGVRATDTVPVRTLPPSRGEMSYSVEESGPHEQPSFAEPLEAGALSTASTGQHVAIDDTVTGERPVALDQGDPLAEADFHMAYGLYDQAADLVQIAISREPNRRELKLKLLEVFFVWGNKERFLQTARELANSRSQALAGEWEKIVIMGRQIAPDDALFTNAGALTGAASGGVDLNLEGGQNRVDFDLLGEPSVGATAEGSTGLDLDLGAALGDNDATGEVKPLGEDGVDFVLDDPERGNDATGSTREMPGGQAATREVAGMGGGTAPKEYTATMRVAAGQVVDPDAPTVEQLQLHGGEHSTIREKIDAAARAGMQTSDQTAELALDDLGLDLGALEGVADETGVTGSSEAPTVLSNLQEDTRELLARARNEQAEADATRRAAAPDAPSDSGTWLFTDTDFAAGMEKVGKDFDAEDSAPTQLVTQITPRPPIEADSTSATSELAALDPGTLDLDVGAASEDTGVNGVDLDVGGPGVTEGTFVQTQRIAAGDMALPELEPATMSEVGTKLDLARAYMDMGDPEGARSILAEVLSEGSVSQKQEARRLMDTLPG